MLYIKNTLILLFIFICCDTYSQNNFNSFGESTVSLSHDMSKPYSFNFIFRSRYFLYESNNFLYKQQQVDAFHFSNFKLNNNYKLSLGCYYRNRDWFETGEDELRFLEQVNYARKKANIRYGHRFRAEQRILGDLTIHRQRYRFALDFPLNKDLEASKKTYLVSSIEGLLSVSKREKPETDIRLSTQIGWQITEGVKIQTGLEHRLEAFNSKGKNNLFVLTSALLKI